MFNRSETKDVFDRMLAENGIADTTSATPAGVADGAPREPQLSDNNDDEVDEPSPADGIRADDTDGTEEEADPAQRDRLQSRSRRIARTALLGIAAVFVCTAVGLATFFGWQLKQQHDIAAAAAAATNAAKSYATALTSIDNTKIDQNFAQVLDGATGQFKDMYSQSAAQLRQLLIDNKAVSHGTIVDAAVKTAAKDKVEVLIFVDQSISNSTNPQPRIDRSRIAITMEHLDGRWLASQVDVK
ncbi:hypothetical protein [Mycobacterium sp. SM3041]|uniref:hypothetical protein n=1 Tax=Mycobacterium sp. SM3041 TaxID=3114291 RepID=UPI0032048F93